MNRDRALQAREKLLAKLPVTGELLRGTLLERTVRHKSAVLNVRVAKGTKYMSSP
jgi:hypothetical protein